MMHLVALSLWVADCWRRLNFSIAMVYISCRKLSWSPTALIDSCLCFTSVIQCMHGDDISLAYISLYYWLILNSTSNLSVHVFAARLYAGSRILLGKLDRYLPKTINDDLVNPQRLGELHYMYLTIIPRARMGYWLRGHGGERNNCFSKIQLVGQKYRE